MARVKAKSKSGVGKGTGKKGWTRWQAGAKKAKNAKPYKSKGVKHGSGSGDEKGTADRAEK
ncbi:DUF3934 family protein [Robertmurraya korlensis]|uniref:DUF3934 family protein n=1 Tax=Robertmurraya korlensis TaxID=519977 RepID=UPI000825360F|nr:DUF3934 family protein [Robertmurraya korlensis]